MVTRARETVDIHVVEVSKTFGEGTQALSRLSLDIKAGELLVILGPSGSGKTTLLNVLAGLETVDSGRVVFGDQDVTSRPAERRDVAVVFQSAILYPHLNLADNMGFAARLAKVPASDIEQRVKTVTAWLGISHLLTRRPHQVSGGERQRAAIAKALVSRPSLLLMDEPFSAVDAQLRRQLRSELVRLHREFGYTTVFVTHDQEEAMAIADRVVVMRTGEVVQIGSPLDLYRRPANAWLADFVSLYPINLIPAEPSDGSLAIALFKDGSVRVPSRGLRLPGRCLLGIRAEDVRIRPSGDGASFRVFTREMVGNQLKYTLRAPSGEDFVCLTSTDQELPLDIGVDVEIAWSNVLIFDPVSGDQIKIHLQEESVNVPRSTPPP